MSAPTIDWDLALIQKYNYSGPRYTSYPTALEFSDAFGEADFQQAVARYPERPLSLYVLFRSATSSATSAAAIKSLPVSSIKPISISMRSNRKFFTVHRCLKGVTSASFTGAAARQPT